MQPLLFDPIIKRIRWGGRRLGERLGKTIGTESDYAESWEVADHGTDQTLVASGEYKGWPLSRLVAEKGNELFGRHAPRTQFPLLIKFLDACDHLSVQVHPNDAQAKTYDPAENGKTEAWVIVDAEPGSKLFAGLKAGVTAEQLGSASADGTVEALLHSFEVAPGECLFIPAGTVHAIGAGIVIAEIQQMSDITFRLYDWGRTGADGKPRELHLDDAIRCTDFDRGPVNPVKPQRQEHASGVTDELVRGEFFVIRRHILEQNWILATDNRFHVLMLVRGKANLRCDGVSTPVPLGQTVLVPASSPDVTLEPLDEVSFIEAFLP